MTSLESVARRMLADAVDERDGQVLGDFTLDDLHQPSVRRYREFFAARRREHAYLDKDEKGSCARSEKHL